MTIEGPMHGVHCPCRGLWRSRGFTAIELILVMAIIGAFAAIAIPRISTVLARQRVQQAAGRISADILRASALARAASRTYTITFVRNSARYTVSGFDASGNSVSWQVTLGDEPYLCKMSSVDFGVDQAFSINGYGVPGEGGKVSLAAGSAGAVVTVDPSLPQPTITSK